jgi:replicative superfamily II helicase
LPIVKLEGIGRTRGRILFNAGYRSIDAIRLAELDELTNLPTIGPRLAKKIKEQVGGFVKKKEWEQLDKVDEWKQKALSDF